MGRYDKIKVYDGSWKAVQRIRVYRGGWIDLGEVNGWNTTNLLAYRSGSAIRATLNRQDYTITGEHYSYGSGSFREGLTSGSTWASGYAHTGEFCWNPKSASWETYVEGTIRKTSNVDQIVFQTTESKENNYLKIIWLADGRLQVTTKYGAGNTPITTLTSSNSVGANTWVYFKVSAPSGSGKATLNFNGVTASKTLNGFMGMNKYNQIGDGAMQFKTLNVSLSGYGSGGKSLHCLRSVDFTQDQTSNYQLNGKLSYYNGDTSGTRWV